VKTLYDIKTALKERKKELYDRYSVKKVGVFGSYVRGEQRRGSDLDVLVEFEEPVSLLKLASLENFLSDLLGAKVDVVPEKDIRSELKKRILSEAVYV